MFPNLKAEMARLGISVKEISTKIDVDKGWLENRLNGKCVLPIEIAFAIWQKCFPNIAIDYLFAQTAIVPSYCQQVTENGKK